MALWSRKRKAETPAPEPPATESSDAVPLADDDDHSWWTQGEVTEAWTPKRRKVAEPERQRDILAEHFGDDWRTSFGFTPPTEEELTAEREAEQRAIDDQDPYKVLEIESTATWDEIVAAHRHQARVHHPDRLFGQSDEEKAEGEDRIRVINAAYQELRIRRGR